MNDSHVKAYRAKKIVDTASQYIGKREKPGNSGFDDFEFERRMKECGWIRGQAWCAYFVELVWKEAYADNRDIREELDKLCSASATATYKNFDVSSNWEVSKTPTPGALVVWRYGTGWKGHIGIVKSVNGNKFEAIEGNTNDSGGREGIEVAVKTRSLDFKVGANKLNLIGFILPR